MLSRNPIAFHLHIVMKACRSSFYCTSAGLSSSLRSQRRCSTGFERQHRFGSSPLTSAKKQLHTRWTYKEIGEFESHEWKGTFWSFRAPNTAGEAVAHRDDNCGFQISPWHDLPRVLPSPSATHSSLNEIGGPSNSASTIHEWLEVVCVVEIPQGSLAKLEMDKELPFNPIVQDVHKKKPLKPLRYLTYGSEKGVPFHYGFIPRTFEDPSKVDTATGCGGDGDPLDVVFIDPQERMLRCRNNQVSLKDDHQFHSFIRGSVWRCRVLGVIPMIDEGETDWKVVVEPVEEVNPKFPLRAVKKLNFGEKQSRGVESSSMSAVYHDVTDIPTVIKAEMLHWFRFYKTSENKPENQFAMNGKIQPALFAAEVVRDCAQQYDNLVLEYSANKNRSEARFWVHKS